MKEDNKKSISPESGIQSGAPERPVETTETDAEAEPKFRLGDIPIWLIVLFGILFYWGQLYIDRHGGGFNAQVYEPYERLALIPAAGPLTEEEMFFAQGKRVYDLNCMGCHQANGMGLPPMFPPLVGSRWVVDNPEVPIRVVLHGLTGPIEVLGQQYNAQMPGVGLGLPNEDLAAVVTYIRRAWGNQASAVTVEEVQAVREGTAGRTQFWTADELAPLLQNGQ
jgi:mono/diheme cytochrome c family protein